MLPSTVKDPEISADPVYGKDAPAFSAYDAVVANDEVTAYDEVAAYDAVIAYDAVKLLVTPGSPFIEPVMLNDPDKEILYASVPVKASTDWVT